MAFSISKYNRNGMSKFNVNTKDLSYHNLREMFENELESAETTGGSFEPGTAVYIFGAAFINPKSKYGETPNVVIMTPDENGEVVPAYIASLPTHLTETIKEMLNDSEAVEAIKNLKVGFTIRKYYNKKFNVNAYTAEWCDVEWERTG